MTEAIAARSEQEVVDAVRGAAADRATLAVEGAGTKSGIGRPVAADRLVRLAALSGITDYEAPELVLTAHAGTPLAVIEAALAEQNQRLAFEPPHLSALMGRDGGGDTIGGILGGNLSGPRRLSAGAARDHFLGLRAVNGRGEAFRAGGKVVKNVTGYDVCKLLAGSWGTLAVLTEVTVKVLPAPKVRRTLAFLGLGDAEAVALMCAAMGSPCDIAACAHLPAGISDPDDAATLLRLEGIPPSVAHRQGHLIAQFGNRAPTRVLADAEDSDVWVKIRDVRYFQNDDQACIWRVSVPPSQGATIAGRISRALPGRHYFDWSGGLIWLAVAMKDASQEAVRAAIGSAGHATLIRAPAAVRSMCAPFQPQPPALAALSRRLKDEFDPMGLLNPGRMAAEKGAVGG